MGNSITAGAGIKNRDKDSYPMMLGQMLGKEYDVRNFGVSGRTMLQKGNSYMKEKAYKQALDFQPDILIESWAQTIPILLSGNTKVNIPKIC